MLAANTPLHVPLELTISHLVLNGILLFRFSKAQREDPAPGARRGVIKTMYFKNDPLEAVKVTSTFDDIRNVSTLLQRLIEDILRMLFSDKMPVLVHEQAEKRYRRIKETQTQGARQPDLVNGDAAGRPAREGLLQGNHETDLVANAIFQPLPQQADAHPFDRKTASPRAGPHGTHLNPQSHHPTSPAMTRPGGIITRLAYDPTWMRLQCGLPTVFAEMTPVDADDVFAMHAMGDDWPHGRVRCQPVSHFLMYPRYAAQQDKGLGAMRQLLRLPVTSTSFVASPVPSHTHGHVDDPYVHEMDGVCVCVGGACRSLTGHVRP